jgi:FAD/FMN-containing dehydrogenase
MKQANALWFDPKSRSWVTQAAGRSVVPVPPLDGALLVDDASRSHAADDFGHLVHHRPIAVLAPRSSEDVVGMVNFAREQGIKIGARGQAMNGSGLSQVEAGL